MLQTTCMEPPPGRLIFNTARGTHKRARKITLNQNSRISSRWRVSRAYILAQNSKRLRINAVTTERNKYIGSRQQRERMENCRQMHMYIDHITETEHIEPETDHMEPWDSILRKSRLWQLCRSLNPVRNRGRRPGRPAGPGLPHGDLTGDDD